MDDPHGVSGIPFPNKPARRVLALGLVLLCALASATIADEPGVLRALPPVTDTAYPPPYASPHSGDITPQTMRLPVVGEPFANTLLYNETAHPNDEYAGRQVGYTAADPYASAARNEDATPRVALRTSKSILNFNHLQGPAGQPNQEGGAGPDAPTADTETNAEGDDNTDGGGEGEGDGEGGQKEEEQTYGQAPTNNSLQFLRQVDVLLKPGKWQFDTGFLYTLFENDFPLPIRSGGPEVTDVVEARVRNRLLYTPLAVRYGLRNNIQLFAVLPTGFSNTQLSTLGVSETTNGGGIGDLTAGASFHLLRGEDLLPDVIGTFGFTAPTGDFTAPVFDLVPGSALGQGFWALSGQLLCINRYDPVIVFYGGGYRHLFERPFETVLYAPGEQISYMFGVGFSVNDRVTLSSTFQGFYITNTFVNSVDVRGSNLEPMSMRFSMTVVRNCRILEPFVQFGITDSAPRANFGIVVTFY